jgi:cytochrome c-type biogenesis protein
MSNQTTIRNTSLLILLLSIAILLMACNNAPAPTEAPTEAPKVVIESPTPAPTATAAPEKEEAAKQEDKKRPMAKDFTAKNLLTGEEISLSDYRGKIVFLNFWGSWCPPCRAEMPSFQEVYEEYGDDVVIIGVGINDSEENLIKFAKSIGVTYPIVQDRTNEIGRTYRVRSLPTTYRINQQGEIQGVAQGGLNKDQLIQAIEELLPKE